MTAEKVLTLSKAFMFVSIGLAILVIAPYIVNHQLTETRNDIKQELSTTRNDVKIQLNEFRTDTVKLINTRSESLQTLTRDLFRQTDKRLGSIQKDTFLLAGNINSNLNARVLDLNTNLDSQLSTFNTNLDKQTTTLNGSIKTVTDSYAAVPGVIATRFGKQTDCERNALCWQNLTSDVLVNFRYTGRDISDSAHVFNQQLPIFMTGVNTTVVNFGHITDNIKRLTTPHWYDRLLGYGLNAGILYSRFNPATNLITVGAQTITGLALPNK
jgi:hypothetical protein